MPWCEGSRRASDATPQAGATAVCILVEPVEQGIPVQLLLHEWRCESSIHIAHAFPMSFSLVKSKTSRKVKSEKSKTGDDFRSPISRHVSRLRWSGDVPHALFLTSCVERVLLYPPCARAHHARRALRTLRPHTPHTATRPDRATRSPRPLDALTPRPLDCTRSQLLESDQMPQRHAWGVTTTVGDAPDPRCPAPHTPMAEMPTTYAHHTCTPHMRTKQALLAQGRETRRLLIGVLRREGPVPRVT